MGEHLHADCNRKGSNMTTPPSPNLVTVTGAFVKDLSMNPATGYLNFQASDVMWDVDLNVAGLFQPISVTLENGGFSVSLLAMDNIGLSGNWHWVVSGEVEGVTLQPKTLIVTYANGATQRFADLLAASPSQ